MTAYTVAHVKTATLAASTADSVTLSGSFGGCLILNRGTSDITVTVDGTTPTVDGDNCIPVPAGLWAEIPFPASIPAANQVVKLISTGTPKYTVTGD